MYGDAASLTYTDRGGNVGGFVQATDTDVASTQWGFVAPSRFLGNKAHFYGGSLRFQIRILSGSVSNTGALSEVVRICSNSSFCVSWHPVVLPLGSGWQTFGVSLVESSFSSSGATPGATLQQVLTSISELRIRGEYVPVGVDVAGLDNVMLVPPTQRISSSIEVAGLEDYTLFGDGTGLQRVVSGGNPGGYVVGQDQNVAGTAWGFALPSKFLGDLTMFYGGLLTFDMLVVSGTPAALPTGASDYLVRICSGATNCMVYRPSFTLSTSGWNSIAVSLEDGDFVSTVAGVMLKQVLAAVTSIQIRGEVASGSSNRAGLDNVLLTALAPTAAGKTSEF